MKKTLLMSCLLSLASSVCAQQTETLYLSGKGLKDTKQWDFKCTKGMNSGKWKKIAVPSQWELQGFGGYSYGRFYTVPGGTVTDEEGDYRYAFKVPAAWKGRKVEIVFEGVMTDTDVKVNGKSAGALHQGGFYRFTYDVTPLLKFGATNKLEVHVSKESANKSVNAAERRADWWLFGGIYRPVFLRALPATHIQRMAVDARQDGTLTAELHLANVPQGARLQYKLTDLSQPNHVLATQVQNLTTAGVQTQTTAWKDVKPWDCEHPNLYVLQLTLQNAQGKVLHQVEQRIGFRTVTFKLQDGLYVNGTKVVLKGVNRHSFHPEGGRTTNKALSVEDALLIKGMNMNAVRSHYPPDTHFLEACDSLGLFYLDELAGWHGAYDATVGSKLVEEMMVRDVNHPCILIWNNGNEGGWNVKLDHLFAQYDPQKRHVIHPWADFDDLDTHHYPAFQTGVGRFVNGYKVFMPTEFMHAMYDEGGGAGLEDFWNNYTSHPLFAGGFIWAFCDESVCRSDRNNELDSDGSNAPDGILGPYREKEASYYTIRDIWSPIQFKKLFITPSFNGEFMITNAYLFTNLSSCTMRYRVLKTPSPLLGGEATELLKGDIQLPALAPGETGRMHMNVAQGFFDGDVLELEATDAYGKSICTWTWPIRYAAGYFARQMKEATHAPAADVKQNGNDITLTANQVAVTFDATNGQLMKIQRNNVEVPLKNGPVTVGMKARFQKGYTRMDGHDALYIAKYLGATDSIVWRMTPDGLLGMDAVILNRGNGGKGFDDAFMDPNVRNLGFTFSFPEKQVTGMRWMGRGPYRVWKNRVRGDNMGLWHKAYNNTVTGQSTGKLEYPEFKGYHGNLYWATLESDTTPFTVYSETDGLFFRVFTPDEPKVLANNKNTMEPFPEGDLSFLLDIPAIQSFKPISQHGPKSQPGNIRIKQGDEGLRIKLWFDFK